LRDSYAALQATGATVVAIAPHSVAELDEHLAKNPYPFTVVADEPGAVFDAYDVTSRMISLGQQPACFIIDTEGIVRFDAVGAQQWDLVGPDDLVKKVNALKPSH
jgi:peroxiredoxin